MTKALLVIFPLPEELISSVTEVSSIDVFSEIESYFGKGKLWVNASFLGVIDGEYSEDVYVLKNRAGRGGAQPLTVLPYHIAKNYRKEPKKEKEEEKTQQYGIYY